MSNWMPDDETFQPVVHYANRLVCRPNESFGPRTIGDDQWIFVQKGIGKARIGKQTFRAVAGSMFHYGPNEPHWFEADESDPFVLFGVHFSLNESLKARTDEPSISIAPVSWQSMDGYEEDGKAGAGLPSHMQVGMWPLPFFEALVEEFSANRPMTPAMLRSVFTQLSIRLSRWMAEYKPDFSPLDRYVYKVRENLVRMSHEAYDPAWLEQWTSYSHDYISRLFSQRFGSAPHQYHQQMKVESAKRLLEQTDATSTSLAAELQFGSVHHFCKWFKRITGVSPQEYRRRRRLL